MMKPRIIYNNDTNIFFINFYYPTQGFLDFWAENLLIRTEITEGMNSRVNEGAFVNSFTAGFPHTIFATKFMPGKRPNLDKNASVEAALDGTNLDDGDFDLKRLKLDGT